MNQDLPAPYFEMIAWELGFIAAVVGLSAAGGVYPIIRKRKELGLLFLHLPMILSTVFWIVAGPVALYMMAVHILYVPVAIWALFRSGQMISFGVKRAQSKENPPEYLNNANPLRLIPSGVILASLAIFVLNFWYLHVWQSYLVPTMKTVQKQLEDLEKTHPSAEE